MFLVRRTHDGRASHAHLLLIRFLPLSNVVLTEEVVYFRDMYKVVYWRVAGYSERIIQRSSVFLVLELSEAPSSTVPAVIRSA